MVSDFLPLNLTPVAGLCSALYVADGYRGAVGKDIHTFTLVPRFTCNNDTSFLKFFFKGFIYLFLERGEGWEKERERNINVWLPLARPLLGTWPTTQACALTEELLLPDSSPPLGFLRFECDLS